MSNQQRLYNEQLEGRKKMFKFWSNFAKECRSKNDEFSKQWLKDNGGVK